MSPSGEVCVGDRVRFYRRSRGKTQAVAGLAGITEDYLSQIERGLKAPALPLARKLAEVLAVPLSDLLGESAPSLVAVPYPAADAVRDAMMAFPAGAVDPYLPELRSRVDAAWSAWQGSRHRFTAVGEVLPGLLADTRAAQRGLATSGAPEQRRTVNQIGADLYFLVRTFTRRSGRADLALLAADRGIAAAEAADDPVRIAAAKWNLCHALLALGEPEAAEEVALTALDDLAREQLADSGDVEAVTGALWLAAVAAATRRGAVWTARDWLREKADPAGRACGETNVMWTVFGPTNILLHAMGLETEAGQASEALRIADTIDISVVPSLERQTTFALDVARCYELRRDDPGVLLHLTSAEATGPEDLRYNATARDLVSGLVKRARPTYARQVRDLARRIELVS